MSFLKTLDSFEREQEENAKVNNPSYFHRETKVAKVIDTVPEIIYQGAYNQEMQSSYSFASASEFQEFEATKRGLLYRGQRVANFCFVIDKMAIMLDTDFSNCYSGYSMQVQVFVYLKDREMVYVLKNVSKEQLESLDILARAPFAVCDSQVSKADFKNILYSYANYLMENYAGKMDKIEYITRSTGWVKFQDKWVYVDSEKALGFPELPLRAQGGVCINNCKSLGGLWKEFQKMRGVIREKGQMDALLVFVLNSFLFTLFNEAGKTIKHCMFLEGARATRKTAVALCFSQLENKESPEFNFLATESGIQSHFRNYHDSCLLIDDLAPSCNTYKKNASEQKLEMIIRLFGDAGRRVINTAFSKASAKELDYSVKGGALITGEYFYSAGVESSIARVIVLEFEKDSVDLERLSYFQQCPEILETLLYRFLVFVAKHWEENKILIRKVVESYRMIYQHKYSNGRYADYIGQYMATAYMLKAFFIENGEIDVLQGDQFCRELEEGMVYLLTVNDCKMKNRAPINTLLLSVIYMTEIGRSVAWGEKLPTETACLIETENAFYLRQKDLPDILKLYCSKTGEPYTQMTSQELGKLLAQADICTIYHEGGEPRLAKKYPKDYGNIRLMELSKESIDRKIGTLINR